MSLLKKTSEKNKNEENLLFIKASQLEKQYGTNYSNLVIYYGFNQNGDYVGQVKLSILNINPPSQIEMEYYSNEKFKNQGNITILAKEVLKEIFEEKLYDDLKVRDNFPLSNIDTVIGQINKDNYASLAVAKKIGFDENGYLSIEDYYNNCNNSSLVK